MRQLGSLDEIVHNCSHVLEGLAVEKACQQDVALFPEGKFFIEFAVVTSRQQAPGLQINQRCSNEQEFGSHLEIKFFHALEFCKICLDNSRQRHLVNVDFFLQDEVQQQVEGPLEHGGRHCICHLYESTARPTSNLGMWLVSSRVFSRRAKCTSATISGRCAIG